MSQFGQLLCPGLLWFCKNSIERTVIPIYPFIRYSRVVPTYLKQIVWCWLARCWDWSKLKDFTTPVEPVRYCKHPEGAKYPEVQVSCETWNVFFFTLTDSFGLHVKVVPPIVVRTKVAGTKVARTKVGPAQSWPDQSWPNSKLPQPKVVPAHSKLLKYDKIGIFKE